MFNNFTANFAIDVVENLPKNLDTGIYFGWASVDDGDVQKMVMSIGWNPYYHNEHKSMVSIIFYVGHRVSHICDVNAVIFVKFQAS